jgi:predicted metal-dependent enzyme (double-stranded beta helix superfamily)
VNERLQTFVDTVTRLVDRNASEEQILPEVRRAMQALVARDDWLPESAARPHPTYYQQYLLYRDPAARFSVVSFVWGPGQKTPVHDHTVWGVIGMLRGAETATPYVIGDGAVRQAGPPVRLEPGDVELVSPTIGDVHQVANAYDDRVSISVHCYGADIGAVRRHVFDPVTGAAKEFVSGYTKV